MPASTAGGPTSVEGAHSGPANAGAHRSAWAVAIALLAPSVTCAAIGLAGVGRRALWADEAYTALSATKSWQDLFTLVTQSNDAVHATYYGLMHVFLQVFGVSALTLRAPSVLFMTAACLGVTVIGWRMATLPTGVLAGFVFALLPVTMDYSTEARSYALSVALATWTSWAFARQLMASRATPLGWLLYGALLTISGFLFMYAWLIVAAHLTTLLFAGRKRASLARGAIPTVAISALLLSPLFWLAERQAGQVAWITRDTVGSLEALGTYMFDRSANTLWWPFAVFVALMMWGTWSVLRRQGGPNERLLLLLAWPWSLLPGLLLIAVSLVKPTFTDRYILFTAPAEALLLGVALREMRWVWRGVALGSLVVIAMLSFTWIFTPAGRDGWGLKAKVLQEEARAGDAIAFSPDAYRQVSAVAGGLPPGVPEVSYTDLMAWDEGARPGRVWVVPFACVLPDDVAAWKEAGYEAADGGAGACSVQPFVKGASGNR